MAKRAVVFDIGGILELTDFFKGLREKYLTGIISNSFVGATHRERERYGFADMCHLLLYSHEVGLEKPDPRIYERWCEKMDVRPEEIVFLDDVVRNIRAAQDLGMDAILYRDNQQAIAESRACLAGRGRTGMSTAALERPSR